MKSKIREKINGIRNEKSVSELQEKSLRIRENLFRTPEFTNARTVMFYVSTRNEVNTGEMIKHSLAMGKTVCVPRTDVEKHSLRCIQVRDPDRDLAPGAFGIPEPPAGAEVPPAKIDLVIVPGTAFDRRGNRIGYGKGFYDRLLPSMKDAHTIGLAYGFQIVPAIPSEEHDVSVKKIVTEDGVINV
ncbi:MAG: 5-formyltetrahydrofolate cyclo-ligase [Candidatus Aenigmatarchaeota archaeon]|nr:MAG: 5-formyltetrahydrofolate cyclo-ligase [Candidatus Aenigmarchaeota archaeon]